jgi:peptidoglycan/xylan/chitin deacetylase (PgdA/CDA1 family)
MPVDLNVKCKQDNHYALTFDDGPSANYPRLLEVLKRNNVKATFFIVGSNLQNDAGAQWFRQAYADGHFMANHTFKHDDLTKLTENEIVMTIESTRAAMIKAANTSDTARLEFSSMVVRPPYGNIEMGTDAVLKEHGYTSVRWNADRYDWDMPGNDPKTTQTILKRVRQQLDYIDDSAAHGNIFNHSILDLNHDSQATTVDAVEELIAIVKARGYEFVTIDVCLGIK